MSADRLVVGLRTLAGIAEPRFVFQKSCALSRAAILSHKSAGIFGTLQVQSSPAERSKRIGRKLHPNEPNYRESIFNTRQVLTASGLLVDHRGDHRLHLNEVHFKNVHSKPNRCGTLRASRSELRTEPNKALTRRNLQKQHPSEGPELIGLITSAEHENVHNEL